MGHKRSCQQCHNIGEARSKKLQVFLKAEFCDFYPLLLVGSEFCHPSCSHQICSLTKFMRFWYSKGIRIQDVSRPWPWPQTTTTQMSNYKAGLSAFRCEQSKEVKGQEEWTCLRWPGWKGKVTEIPPRTWELTRVLKANKIYQEGMCECPDVGQSKVYSGTCKHEWVAVGVTWYGVDVWYAETTVDLAWP